MSVKKIKGHLTKDTEHESPSETQRKAALEQMAFMRGVRVVLYMYKYSTRVCIDICLNLLASQYSRERGKEGGKEGGRGKEEKAKAAHGGKAHRRRAEKS